MDAERKLTEEEAVTEVFQIIKQTFHFNRTIADVQKVSRLLMRCLGEFIQGWQKTARRPFGQ